MRKRAAGEHEQLEGVVEILRSSPDGKDSDDVRQTLELLVLAGRRFRMRS